MRFLADFISLLQFLGYFWSKNRNNEKKKKNEPKNA